MADYTNRDMANRDRALKAARVLKRTSDTHMSLTELCRNSNMFPSERSLFKPPRVMATTKVRQESVVVRKHVNDSRPLAVFVTKSNRRKSYRSSNE